jgi:hypothetical protein
VPGKDLAETLWSSFPGAAKQNRTRPQPGRKTGIFEMTFTGSLIESLMATVERAERRASSDEPMFAQSMDAQTWFVSIQQNADYDPKFLGVA